MCGESADLLVGFSLDVAGGPTLAGLLRHRGPYEGVWAGTDDADRDLAKGVTLLLEPLGRFCRPSEQGGGGVCVRRVGLHDRLDCCRRAVVAGLASCSDLIGCVEQRCGDAKADSDDRCCATTSSRHHAPPPLPQCVYGQ